METDFLPSDYMNAVPAFPAVYSGMFVEDDVLNFDIPHYHATDISDNLNFLNDNGFQAPNDQDLAAFFSSEDFFGEQQASNVAVETTSYPPAPFEAEMNNNAGPGSDYYDSSASSSPSSNSESLASVTNFSAEDSAIPIVKKRRQNREAAKRYRLKKKSASRAIVEEEKSLEMANAALRQNIDRLEAKLAVIKDILRHQYGFPADSDFVMVHVA